LDLALNTELATASPDDGLDLLGRARSGDREAFDALCRQHRETLHRHAIALCGSPASGEDLVQETLLEAWRCRSRFNGRCRYFTWLCSILIHRHRNSLRKHWPTPFSWLFDADRRKSEDFLDRSADPAPDPGANAQQAEQAVRVLRSLEALPARQREVVYLRFYADESLQGIAGALGCSVGTVKSRLFHGLERLRRMKALAEKEIL
jgi:RNA polymerase sigma-70 factor (ECF subfamily)